MRRASIFNFTTQVGGLFSAQRNLFCSTRIKYPCRYDLGDEDIAKLARERAELEESRKERNRLLQERSNAFERKLCVARSVMAKMHVILQEAQHSGKAQIPVELANAITKQLHEHRVHRLEDHQFEIKKTREDLQSVQKEIESYKYEKYESKYDKLCVKERALKKLLDELEKVDTHSNDFLDRETSPFTRHQP